MTDVERLASEMHDMADPCTVCRARHTADEAVALNSVLSLASNTRPGVDTHTLTEATVSPASSADVTPRPRGSWHRELARPFAPNEIAAKPRLWCEPCRKAADKVCNQHKKVKCPDCKQWITEAHVDLSYVGHADITRRLLEADPYWSWRPAQHKVDKDILLAAIASGDADIVDMVIRNAPPLTDEYGGMWMILTVHDDQGRPVETLGYGDHESKPPGNEATKVVIGDGIRNAAMRRGLALDLWSKSDRAENDRERLQSEAAEKTSEKSRAATTTKTRGRQPMPSNGETVVAAQAIVNKAFDMAERYVNLRQAGKMKQPLATVLDQLAAETLNEARAKRLMSVKVYSRWTSDEMTVNEALRQAKQRIEDCDKTMTAQGAQKGETGEQAGE